jgi:hypothetical protein
MEDNPMRVRSSYNSFYCVLPNGLDIGHDDHVTGANAGGDASSI